MLVGTKIQMGSNIHADVFAPCQIFVFGAMNFITNLAGQIEPVDTYAPGQVLFFGYLAFVTDACGELVLHNPAPCWLPAPEPIFSNPPTSHFVATIDSLHQVLDEPGEESDGSSPEAIPTPWTTPPPQEAATTTMTTTSLTRKHLHNSPRGCRAPMTTQKVWR